MDACPLQKRPYLKKRTKSYQQESLTGTQSELYKSKQSSLKKLKSVQKIKNKLFHKAGDSKKGARTLSQRVEAIRDAVHKIACVMHSALQPLIMKIITVARRWSCRGRTFKRAF